MKFSPKLQLAINTSAQLHHGQLRHLEAGLPYVSHCFSVAMILRNYTEDETIIIAGLLHDTIEDVPGCNYDYLKKHFGKKVADIVRGVSEAENSKEMKKVSWRVRKEVYLAKMRLNKPAALMVTAADKINNLRSLTLGQAMYGAKVWQAFHHSPADYHWFYQEVLTILEDRLDSPIVKEYRQVFKQAKPLFNSKLWTKK